MVTADEARAAVAENKSWYHVIEVAPGVKTPGGWDLAPTIDLLPWPDLTGKRCLDVGTYDGFLAFEMERRGAAEVVAVDISDHTQWDWPPAEREAGIAAMNKNLSDKGTGFRIAHRLLGSQVDRREVSAYDLSPETVGEFDFVIMGDLTLHLRDPLRAINAIRSVTRGHFMSVELIEPMLTLLHPRRPVATIYPGFGPRQWNIPNAVGHQKMLYSMGFELERIVRFGLRSQGVITAPPGWRGRVSAFASRRAAGMEGAPHQAILARPRI